MLIVGKDILGKIDVLVKGRRTAIITDETVAKLHLKALTKHIKNPLTFVVPGGEESKSRKTKDKIDDFLLDNSVDRNSVIIAFGGGVITDLAGYVASTYKRGISYINVPTTLLSMVDASIGGKTGINTKHGKNLIGTIWQPEAVVSDISFLKTLPKDELKSGMAEVIKIAAIMDRNFFRLLETVEINDEDSLIKIIKKSSELKLRIVKGDERDNGKRNLLNFGHTIGHSIESCSDYKLKHGFCVSIGMAIEARLSREMDILKETEYDRLICLLMRYKLPTHIPELSMECTLKAIENDKKITDGKINAVLLDKIGKSKLAMLDIQLMRKVLK